jgi:acyl carrier protein
MKVADQLDTKDQELRRMSVRETLRTTLVNLLEEEMGEKYPLPQDDQDLRESLGLDSVDVVGLVMRIEREFRVRLAPEELANVKVVGDLLDLMEAKLAVQAVASPNGAAHGEKTDAT